MVVKRRMQNLQIEKVCVLTFPFTHFSFERRDSIFSGPPVHFPNIVNPSLQPQFYPRNLFQHRSFKATQPFSILAPIPKTNIVCFLPFCHW
jgi:hypothetical protein